MARETRASTLKKVSAPISIKKNKGVNDPAGMRARLVGSHKDTITAGQSKSMDWLIPSLSWKGSNKQTYFDGIEYYAQDAELGDHITFQVVDVDGILPGDATVIEEFATNFYVVPNQSRTIKLYKGKLEPGLYIRIIYNSTGSNDVNFIANMLRHLDETKRKKLD